MGCCYWCRFYVRVGLVLCFIAGVGRAVEDAIVRALDAGMIAVLNLLPF
jgi:hypothetical protein